MRGGLLIILLFSCIFIQQSTQQATSCKRSNSLFNQCLKELFGGWLKELGSLSYIARDIGTVTINRDTVFNLKVVSTGITATDYNTGLLVSDVAFDFPISKRKIVPWKIGQKDLTIDLKVEIPSITISAANYKADVNLFGTLTQLTGAYTIRVDGITQYIRMKLERVSDNGQIYLSIENLEYDFTMKSVSVPDFTETNLPITEEDLKAYFTSIARNDMYTILSNMKSQFIRTFTRDVTGLFQKHFDDTPEDILFPY